MKKAKSFLFSSQQTQDVCTHRCPPYSAAQQRGGPILRLARRAGFPGESEARLGMLPSQLRSGGPTVEVGAGARKMTEPPWGTLRRRAGADLDLKNVVLGNQTNHKIK